MLARDHTKAHGMTTVFKGYGFFDSDFNVNDPIHFFLRYSICAINFFLKGYYFCYYATAWPHFVNFRFSEQMNLCIFCDKLKKVWKI